MSNTINLESKELLWFLHFFRGFLKRTFIQYLLMANFSLSVLQHGIARLIRKYGLLNCLNKWNRSSADLSSSQANNAQTFSFIYLLMIMVFKVKAKSNIIFWRNSTLLFGIVAVLVFERVYARGDIQTHRPECVWEGWVNKRERKGQPEFMCVWRQEEIQIIQRWSFGLTRSANAGTFKLMSKFFFSLLLFRLNELLMWGQVSTRLR